MSKRTTKKAKPSPPSAGSPKPEKQDARTAAPQESTESSAPKHQGTLLAGGLPPPIDFNGLFTLHIEPDGTRRAELGPLTAPRSQRLSWKLDEYENALAMAMAGAAALHEIELPHLPEPRITVPFGGSNAHEIHHAAQEIQGLALFMKQTLARLNQAIGAEIRTLTKPEAASQARKKARSNAEKKFSKALDALELKSRRKAHQSAATVNYLLDNGETREMPLAWIALEIGRQLVQRDLALPSKGKLQAEIEKQFPESPDFSQATWSNAWKEAGLNVLPEYKAWTEDESVKSRRRKARLARKQKRQGRAGKDNSKQ